MISKKDDRAMLITSMKMNSTNKWSNMTGEAKVEMMNANEEHFVEYLWDTQWYNKPIDSGFFRDTVYRIKSDYV
jgi:hypothetical protein